jgi:hypothetical protein
MYQAMQRDLLNLKTQLLNNNGNERDSMPMTIRQMTMCEDNNFANQSFRGSPDRVGSARTGDMMFNSRGYPTDQV